MNLTGPVILAPGDTVSSLNPLSAPQTHFVLISASYPSISFHSLSPSHPLSLLSLSLPLFFLLQLVVWEEKGLVKAWEGAKR